MLLTISYSPSAYPIARVETLKATLRLFWNFSIFCLLYTHINNSKYVYDKFKLRNQDSANSICFSQDILNYLLFDEHPDEEIYNIFQKFYYSSITLLQTGQTNTHTHTHIDSGIALEFISSNVYLACLFSFPKLSNRRGNRNNWNVSSTLQTMYQCSIRS